MPKGDFKAIGHVFVEDAYVDSYPLLRKSQKDAENIFRRIGFFVGKPWLNIYVDGIPDFLEGKGALSPEDFMQWTGLDLITWIWGPDKDDYPSYIRQLLNGTGPIALKMSDEEWQRRWQEHKRAKNVWIALEKVVRKNWDRMENLLLKIAADVARRLKNDDEHTALEFVVDVLRESDLDIY